LLALDEPALHVPLAPASCSNSLRIHSIEAATDFVDPVPGRAVVSIVVACLLSDEVLIDAIFERIAVTIPPRTRPKITCAAKLPPSITREEEASSLPPHAHPPRGALGRRYLFH